jgi:hypothetical protein
VNKQTSFVVPFMALTLGVLAMVAHAQADILDQDNSGPLTGGGSVATGFVQAQTFTVGMDGVLSRIAAGIHRGGSAVEDITLTLLTTDVGGAPDSILTSAVLTPGDVGTAFSFVSFDISSANIAVTTGDLLAIQLSSPAANNFPFSQRYEWAQGPSYAGGPHTPTARTGILTFNSKPT